MCGADELVGCLTHFNVHILMSLMVFMERLV